MAQVIEARKYRKRPVVIEAVQYDGTRQCAGYLKAWSEGAVKFGRAGNPIIDTPEGRLRVKDGDWIIREKGEFYPCDGGIFLMTHEPADEAAGPVEMWTEQDGWIAYDGRMPGPGEMLRIRRFLGAG